MLVAGIDRRLLKRLPAFSPIAVRLLSVLDDEGVSFTEIARLIALDPALVVEVLRLANSGLYGRRHEVCSILEAIAMLGSGKVGQVAVTAALWRGLPHRNDAFVRAWWRHNVAAAFVAREFVARKFGQEAGIDPAYTAGLLHGVGQLALFEDAPKDYPGLVERSYVQGLDLLEIEREMFDVDHALLAGVLLESWGLPQPLYDAAARQHNPNISFGLVLAVQTGCVGAEYAGFGRCGCHHSLAAGVPDQLAELLTRGYDFEKLITDINQLECYLG